MKKLALNQVARYGLCNIDPQNNQRTNSKKSFHPADCLMFTSGRVNIWNPRSRRSNWRWLQRFGTPNLLIYSRLFKICPVCFLVVGWMIRSLWTCSPCFWIVWISIQKSSFWILFSFKASLPRRRNLPLMATNTSSSHTIGKEFIGACSFWKFPLRMSWFLILWLRQKTNIERVFCAFFIFVNTIWESRISPHNRSSRMSSPLQIIVAPGPFRLKVLQTVQNSLNNFLLSRPGIKIIIAIVALLRSCARSTCCPTTFPRGSFQDSSRRRPMFSRSCRWITWIKLFARKFLRPSSL